MKFVPLTQGEEGPFLVANLDALFEKHVRWLTSLPRVKPFYAVKCNNTPVVLRMLSALGTGFDCASKVLQYIRTATIFRTRRWYILMWALPGVQQTWALSGMPQAK